MKATILAGGFGTRISEESHLKPKPMVEIGEMPILWHIMKGLSHYGINDFIICAGYKQFVIKDWFANYFLYNSDVTFDFTKGNSVIVHDKFSEPWKVTVIDTGLNTMTGGRIKRVSKYIGSETFLMTYGDGVSDVNIDELISFHKKNGKLATLTAIRAEGRFGMMDLSDNVVTTFKEKKQSDMGWINGGFMILEPEVMNYITDDEDMFERSPMENLAADGQLMCYKHDGFWQCMDTLRDKEKLDLLWQLGKAPWKIW